MFNRSDQSNKTLKGAGVLKNDTKLISHWDILLALVLLTRLPIPRLPEDAFDRQGLAAWAFPSAGFVVGALACAAGWVGSAWGLPPLACAIILVAVLILCTGAMHEDGLADTTDGFWGGFDPARRLEIMKDSHIGTYGVLALILSQALRVALIAPLLATGAFGGILTACILSRAMMPILMTALPNARNAGLSHSVGAPLSSTTGIGAAFALAMALILIGAPAFKALIVAALVTFAIGLVARSKIRGQTGDVLGATQVMTELAILIALAAAL